MDKTALYLAYFVIYSLIMLVIGKNSLRGSNTPQDYFICGKQVSLPFCAATFTGTWISAITILSLTGSVYEDGLPVLFYSVIPWFFGAFLMGCAARKIHDSDGITVPEMFRKKYDSRGMQLVYGLIFIGVYVFYMVAQYKGFGMVASEIFDIPYPTAVLLVYLFILYTTIGGYRSVVRTDMANLILLLLSLLLLMAGLVRSVGGFPELYRKAAGIEGLAHAGVRTVTEKGQMLRLFGGRYTRVVSLSMFWGWGLGLSANPQYLVRLMSAKDRNAAQKTVAISMGILAVIYLSLIHIGLAMRVLVPRIDGEISTDGIFIRLMNHELYSPLSGIFFFSVIGACISTANSQLLMVASSFAYDVVNASWKKPLTNRQTVRLARIVVLAAGTLAMILTLNPPAFTLSYGGDLWGIIGILVFPQLYIPLIRDDITRGGIWCSILAGILIILLTYPCYYLGILKVHPAFPGIPFTSLVLLYGSALEEKDAENAPGGRAEGKEEDHEPA